MNICKYCKKENKNLNSNTQHEIRCKENSGRVIPFEVGKKNKNKIPWNKGLTKDTDDRVKSYSIKIANKIKGEENPFYGKNHTNETKKIISEKLSLNNKGGKCKWYESFTPKGKLFLVQGTWELKFTKFLNLIDDEWIKIGIGKNEHSYKWIDENGKIRTYTPDFWSPKLKKYFEIKGYWREKDKIKMKFVLEQNEINLEIVTKKELDYYLKLVP
jgi:hypothetical protein